MGEIDCNTFNTTCTKIVFLFASLVGLTFSNSCFLYSGERQTLFINLVEHYIPNFTKLNKTNQFEILQLGISPENPEFHTTNTI